MNASTATASNPQQRLQSQRVLAPDLARGLMLLLIVLAHAPLYLVGVEAGVLQHPAGGTAVDQVVRAATVLFIDGRAYPLFAALFGYGLATIASRHLAAGFDRRQVRRLLRRRGLWLMAFGLAHALLVTPVEILGAYGVAALLTAGLMLRRDRTLLAVAIALVPVLAITASLGEYLFSQAEAASPVVMGALGYSSVDLVARVSGWLTAVAVNVTMLPVVVAMLLGAWAARRGLLEHPHHDRRLRRAAACGIGVAVLGGIPLVLTDVGLMAPDRLWVYATLHVFTGLVGGLSYAAGLAVLARQRAARKPRTVRLLAAAGKRSLTCYLLQSTLLVVLLSQTFLGLGAHVHSAGAAVVAVAAWGGALTVAGVLERNGRRGPADTLLRRLATRRRDALPTERSLTEAQ